MYISKLSNNQNMRINLFYIFSLGCLMISCTSPGSDKNKIVQVYAEPMHQLVFEKGEVKILDVQIMPHDTTQFHIHSNPMFYVSLGWQKDAAQLLNGEWGAYDAEWPGGEVDSDTSYALTPIVHRATNGGTTVSRLIGIVNMGKGISVNNNSTEYEVANKWFRSKRIFLDAGDTINTPKPDFPVILVVVSGTKLKIIPNKGKENFERKWFYLEDKYTLINLGDAKLEIIKIEVLN